MNAKRYVLDTSAILTLIEDEPGADRVQTILREGQVWLPWVVLLEATYITRQEQGESEANLRYALLTELPVTIGWEVDEPLLLTAARLKATHRVSLADAIIAAYAIRQGATLVHKDPEYESLSSELDLETLPYKGRAGTT
jgi:predicted nucleic acid-binding protein